MFETEVTTKDGHVKRVVAGSQEELDEAVKVLKNDVQAVSPDLHAPAEPNAIVSPENKAVEDVPAFVDNSVEVEEPVVEEAPKSKPAPKK
jgi:hypothetical protein